MQTAKLFLVRGGQAVRLPKNCEFDVDEVCVNKLGDLVILFPRDNGWKILEQGINKFSTDFMKDRSQPTKADRRVEPSKRHQC